MASKVVEWTSFNRLSCAGCTPADVLLCTTYNVVIPAQLVSFQTFNNGCGGKFYRYVFNYDSADLPEGVTGLTCATITGAVCKGCLTQWIEQQDAAIETEIALLEEQIAIDISAARPLIFNSQTTDASFSFLADPGATHDVDLTITNPSTTRPLEVDISWGWGMNIQSTDDYNDATITGQLYIDGSAISGATGTTAVRFAIDAVPDHLRFAGTGGHHHLTVAAGASILARLRMSATVTVPAPDTIFEAERMYVSAFGVTS